MRLLDTITGQFVEKDPEDTKYAILSHTWDKDGEQTYKQLRKIQKRNESHDGSPLVRNPYGPGPLTWTRHWIAPEDSIPSDLRSSSSATLLSASCGSRGRVHVGEVSQNDPSPEPTPLRSIWSDPELSPKILGACAVARADGYRYLWIDSCCIDKSSSSELSEAINSMYAWYAGAHICYAYLADVPYRKNPRNPRSMFRESRWFKRGWTLQELIAPLHLVFLSQDWSVIGPKSVLVDIVQEVTGISDEALLHLTSLDKFSVAQRLSWASTRTTTRVEDRAYSLLGIFDINMPTLYGEGMGALRRLQERIMQRIPDHSLFAWGKVYLGPIAVDQHNDAAGPQAWQGRLTPYLCGQRHPNFLLSPYLTSYSLCGSINAVSRSTFLHFQLEYTPSPYGIRTQFHMIPLSLFLPTGLTRYRWSGKDEHWPKWYLVILGCEHAQCPGQLLGRVCYVSPSESGVQVLYPGCVFINLTRDREMHDLFPLSPETIERCRPHLELLTVYISHPDRRSTPMRSILIQPHPDIALLLLKNTRDALRTHGFTAELSRLSPTSHRLLLRNNDNSITIAFQHSLTSRGRHLLINAFAATPGLDGQLEPQPQSNLPDADPVMVSWTHSFPWHARLSQTRNIVVHTGNKKLTILLRLQFACIGAYVIHVEVDADNAPPAPESSLSVKRIQEEELGVSGSAADGSLGVQDEANGGTRVVESVGLGDSGLDAAGTQVVDGDGDMGKSWLTKNARWRKMRETQEGFGARGKIRSIRKWMADATLRIRA